MSIPPLLAALRVEDLPPGAKLTLVVLADFADAAGTCWPSVATLARRVGASERAVQQWLRLLEARGYLARRGPRRGGRARPTVYHLTLAKGAPAAPFVAEKGARGSQKGAPRAPEPTREPGSSSSTPPAEASGRRAPARPAPACVPPPPLAAFDQQLRAHPSYRPTPAFYATLTRLLAAAPALDLVAEAVALTDWCAEHQQPITTRLVLSWLRRAVARPPVAPPAPASPAKGGAHAPHGRARVYCTDQFLAQLEAFERAHGLR
jgi:hypothetical protein